MTVRENVLMGAYIIRRDKALVAKRYDEVAELFPIVAERADDKRAATCPAASGGWSSSPAR